MKNLICAHILRSVMRDGDIEAEYAADYYTAPASDPITGDSGKRVHAVRVIIQEDRYIIGKHQWFCDRTTEKTVSLSVHIILNFIINSNRNHCYQF